MGGAGRPGGVWAVAAARRLHRIGSTVRLIDSAASARRATLSTSARSTARGERKGGREPVHEVVEEVLVLQLEMLAHVLEHGRERAQRLSESGMVSSLRASVKRYLACSVLHERAQRGKLADRATGSLQHRDEHRHAESTHGVGVLQVIRSSSETMTRHTSRIGGSPNGSMWIARLALPLRCRLDVALCSA